MSEENRKSVEVMTLNVDDLKWLILEIVPFMKVHDEDAFFTFKGQEYKIPKGIKFNTFRTWLTCPKESRSLNPAGRTGAVFIEALKKREQEKLSYHVWEFEVMKVGSRYTGNIFLHDGMVDGNRDENRRILASVVYLGNQRKFNPMVAYN